MIKFKICNTHMTIFLITETSFIFGILICRMKSFEVKLNVMYVRVFLSWIKRDVGDAGAGVKGKKEEK